MIYFCLVCVCMCVSMNAIYRERQTGNHNYLTSLFSLQDAIFCWSKLQKKETILWPLQVTLHPQIAHAFSSAVPGADTCTRAQETGLLGCFVCKSMWQQKEKAAKLNKSWQIADSNSLLIGIQRMCVFMQGLYYKAFSCQACITHWYLYGDLYGAGGFTFLKKSEQCK